MFPSAAREQWNARWRSLQSNAAGACWNSIKQTVLWLFGLLSNSNLMWIRLLTSPFWSGTGISLKLWSGRPSVSEQVVDRVRESFLRSPKKSTRRASRELKFPQSTVSKILTQTLAVTPLQAAIGPKVTPGRQGNSTCILRESPSVNRKKWLWPAGKDHFQWWGDLPLKCKGQQVQCKDMGGVKIRIPLWRLNVTLQNSMCFVSYQSRLCTARSSLRDKTLRAEGTWKC